MHQAENRQDSRDSSRSQEDPSAQDSRDALIRDSSVVEVRRSEVYPEGRYMQISNHLNRDERVKDFRL